MDKRIDEFSGLKGISLVTYLSKDTVFIFLGLIHGPLLFFFLLVYSKHKPAIKSKLFRNIQLRTFQL